MSLKIYENIQKLSQLANLIPIALVIVFLHLARQNGNMVHLDKKVYIQQGPIVSNDSFSRRCDLFSGRWIYENISYPLYKEQQCSFMEDEFACEKFGRKDLKYQNWRWQPHHCDLPRFNGAALLDKIKGKKLIFVGDSLLRNQWRSMLCLIDSYLPASSDKSVKLNGNLMYYHAIEYNATIGFYWSPVLVGSSGDDVENHEGGALSLTVQVKSIEEHGRHWVDADFLIFDSYAWWIGSKRLTVLWGSFGSPNATRKTISKSRRPFEIALNTWSDWLEMNINRTKTKLFFTSLSPFHYESQSGDEQSCYNQTEPIFKEDYWGPGANRDMMIKAETIIHNLEKRGVKVEYLNVTHLSDYRKDAHPSIYRSFSRGQKAKPVDPKTHCDCLHWCLPGLPDVWNQILYSYVIDPIKQ